MSAVELELLSKETKEKLFNYLVNFVSKQKQEKFDETLSLRTRHLTILLENIYHPHNANACIRTSECFGIQDIHIIEDQYEYQVNPRVLRGSAKWVTLHKHTGTLDAIKTLRSNGYKIAATSPNEGSVRLEHLPVNEKIAVAFGTEREGASPELLDHADYKVYIPMYGFTESFNISVSVAITLHYLIEKIRLNQSIDWQLTKEEIEYLLLEWVIKSVARPDIHINQFFKREQEIEK